MFVPARSWNCSRRAACSSTSLATRVWGFEGRAPRRSRTRCARWVRACTTTPSITARSTFGIPPPGEISDALLPYPGRCSAARRYGRRTRRSAGYEIRDGVIQNPKIPSFQGRAKEFPRTTGSDPMRPLGRGTSVDGSTADDYPVPEVSGKEINPPHLPQAPCSRAQRPASPSEYA